MKEIKANIRQSKADIVIEKLEASGVSGMTVIDVHALCDWADKESFSYSIEYVQKYSRVVKIKLVCNDSDVDKLVNIISKYGKTGTVNDFDHL